MNETTFRVRYGETDRMGVVYHTAYIDWFAIGRTEWLRDKGMSYRGAFEEEGLYLPVIRVECTYKNSVTYDDPVTVRTTVDSFSPTRIRFHYRITGPAAILAAEGITEHAFLDGSAGKPVNLQKARPELWQALQAIAAS